MADEQQRANDSERSVASNRHGSEDAGNTNDDDARNQGRPETGPSQPPAPFSQASQVGRARSRRFARLRTRARRDSTRRLGRPRPD